MPPPGAVDRTVPVPISCPTCEACANVAEVSHESLVRFIELVRRELNAGDARIEIGGRVPDDEHCLWTELPGGWRLVVLFDGPPDRREESMERLRVLLQSFSGVINRALKESEKTLAVSTDKLLSDALESVVARAGATNAVIIDISSPVVWAWSGARPGVQEDVEGLLRTASLIGRAREAGVDLPALLAAAPEQAGEGLAKLAPALQASLRRELPQLRQRYPDADAATWMRYLLTVRAVAAVRRGSSSLKKGAGKPYRTVQREPDYGCLARSFADIYVLILAFDGIFSELHAEAAMLRALPMIERLVQSLPPVDPPPSGGRVIELRPVK